METTTAKRSFDPGVLFSDLQQLLSLYLARAKDAEAVAEMPAKDALACAKTTTEMMSALQAGKLAAVDEHTEWPKLERIAPIASIAVGRGLRAPPSCVGARHGVPVPSSDGERAIRVFDPEAQTRRELPLRPTIQQPTLARHSLGDGGTNNEQLATAPIPLAEFVAQICQPDDEVDVLEPYQRLVARINRLSDMCEEWFEHRAEKSTAERAACPPPSSGSAFPNLESRLSSRDSRDMDSGLESPDSAVGASSVERGLRAPPSTNIEDSPVGRPPVGRHLETPEEKRRGTGPRPTVIPLANNQKPATNNGAPATPT